MTSEFEEYPHFFEVRTTLFEGPIDLLLHLVKQNELPLDKLSLAEVTSQYLGCLEEMRRFDLEVAGEYLVIAATLLTLKSSMLLGRPVELIEDESGNLIDPHEELLRRLREAEVYKFGARELELRPLLGIDVFAAPSSLSEFESVEPGYRNHDPILLGKAFQKILGQLAANNNLYKISLESVSILDRMMSILDHLRSELAGKGHPHVGFRALIPDLTSKASVIGTFIALLELCKRQVIFVRQEGSEDEIVIGLARADVLEQIDRKHFTSEFDFTQPLADVVGS